MGWMQIVRASRPTRLPYLLLTLSLVYATRALAAAPLAPSVALRPPPAARTVSSCTQALGERERLLALDIKAFDRSNDGWRPYGEAHCYSEAAGLLNDYVQGRATTLTADDEALLRFHAAQMLADADRIDDAIGEFARVLDLDPRRQAPDPGWRLYVQGSIAFLREDRPGLDRTVRELDQYAGGEAGPVQAGDRLNLNALHGLQRCFGRNYAYAYGSAECRDLDEARRLNQAIG